MWGEPQALKPVIERNSTSGLSAPHRPHTLKHDCLPNHICLQMQGSLPADTTNTPCATDLQRCLCIDKHHPSAPCYKERGWFRALNLSLKFNIVDAFDIVDRFKCSKPPTHPGTRRADAAHQLDKDTCSCRAVFQRTLLTSPMPKHLHNANHLRTECIFQDKRHHAARTVITSEHLHPSVALHPSYAPWRNCNTT